MGERTTLIQARLRRNISRIQLAERLDVTRQYVMRVEQGLRTPSLDLATRWADALGVKIDIFRTETSEAA